MPRHRKYACNENFFSEVDTYEKAYLLGVLATDGNVHRETRSNTFTTQIHVSQECKQFCDNLYGYIGGGPPAHNLKANSWHWSFSSLRMGQDFINLGITPDKTHDLSVRMDLIPDIFIPSFIHGVMDGDGSIILPRGKYANVASRISLNISTASSLFAKQMATLLPTWKLTLKDNGRGYCPGSTIWSLDCRGLEDVYRALSGDLLCSHLGLVYKKEAAKTAIAAIENSLTFKRLAKGKLARITPDLIPKILELSRNGLNQRQIAEVIGTYRQVISSILHSN